MLGLTDEKVESYDLSPIYKRTSTGKVQSWLVEVEGNKYRTVAGQLDGKKVTSEWTVCKGKNPGKKNATTDEEQALKEALAKRRLKLEGEYRKTVDEIDNRDFYEPLLAKDYKEYTDRVVFSDGIWSQPKLDGVRCIIRKDGMFSRNGKPFVAAPHIFASFKEIFEIEPDLEFDGELYNHTLKADFDTLISLIKQSKPTADDLKKSEEKVQYWIYDVRLKDLNFEERNEKIKGYFKVNKPFYLHRYIKYVDTAKIKNQETLDLHYAAYLEDGFEGQMVRLKGEGYEFKRSVNLLKRKEFLDEDFLILDIKEGEGNRSGMAGRMCFEREGKPFDANMRGGVEQYKDWLVNKADYINKKKATVRYQNLTPDGIPRFPVVVGVRDYE